MWMMSCPSRAIVFVNETSDRWIHTACGGGGSWKTFIWHTWVRVGCAHACVCAHVCLITSWTVWKCLWETCLSEDKSYFYHSSDLTQMELRLMCLAFFRFLTLCVIVWACVFACVFFGGGGGEHRLVGASCLPSGSKFCVFPTNLQHTAKPKAALPASV